MSIKKKYKNLGKGGPGDVAPQTPVMPAGMPAGMPTMPEGMPAMPVGAPSQPTQGQDVGPEARAKLASMVEDLKSKQGQMNAMKFADNNKSESERQKALMEVFTAMQEAGVDPSNLEQVKAFLDEVEKKNPELYKVFVSAFEALLGQQMEGASQTVIPKTGGALSSMVGQEQPVPGSDQMPQDISGQTGMFQSPIK